jgi:hypothetical protein
MGVLLALTWLAVQCSNKIVALCTHCQVLCEVDQRVCRVHRCLRWLASPDRVTDGGPFGVVDGCVMETLCPNVFDENGNLITGVRRPLACEDGTCTQQEPCPSEGDAPTCGIDRNPETFQILPCCPGVHYAARHACISPSESRSTTLHAVVTMVRHHLMVECHVTTSHI